MLFTSLEFLLLLPVAATVFWWLPGRWRLSWLLLLSLGFYASFDLANLAYFGVVAALALIIGQHLANPNGGRRQLSLWFGILSIAGLLCALKYYDPIVENVAWLPTLGLTAPAGFSFYAFTAIALIIDRYRSPVETAASARQDLLYLAWFPKILAGPIERVTPFKEELLRRAPMKPVHFALGGQLFLWGLVKKVVVADNLAPFVDRAYAIPDYAVPLELIIATYFFAFQIYCDFSGYTDMARGASQMFGIRLSENFRRSYFAKSISEFWSRRWHISLASWFRDYLYYPFIGQSRAGLRVYAGLMIVFMVSGIWHAGLGYGIGVGFLAWGALNGAYLCAERALSPVRKRVRTRMHGARFEWVYTLFTTLLVFHLVLVSWVFFRAADLGDGVTVLTRIWFALPEIPGLLLRYPFTAEHGFLAALIVGLLVIEFTQERKSLKKRLSRAPRPLRWVAAYLGLFALLLLGRWQSEAFVYMQF